MEKGQGQVAGIVKCQSGLSRREMDAVFLELAREQASDMA
jgi:hypothetical protein